MPIRRTLERTVSHLRELLDKITGDGSSEKPVAPIYEDIKTWLKEKKDWFPKLTHFEDELMAEIAKLEQVIDNASYAGGKPDGGKPEAKRVQDIDNATHGGKLDAEIVQDAKVVQGTDNATHGGGKPEAEHVQDIEKCFGSIKALIEKISLDKYEVPQPTREEVESEGRKMSKDWLDLGIEESILESPAMATLELSYTILDLPLKMCLLCFAIFPEKAIIKKRQLIYWWIGEGFVRKTREKTAEEAGEEAFKKLIDMGLIYPEYKKAKQDKKESPVVDSCTMHPWIRRMVITVAKKAEFFDLDRRGAPTDKSSQSRRICFAKDLVVDQKVTPPPNINESEDQQPSFTLFNKGQQYQLPFITLFNIDQKYVEINQEWFSKLNRVAVLQLGRWQHEPRHHVEVENQDFLKHLGALTHLKYLSLRGMSRITELPSSVLDLVLLQILDLRACHNLERLPPDISSLRKLTHLDLSECYLLESMPKGLDKLFSLQVLKGFVIETSRRSSGRLVDLSRLKKLRKLSIYIGSQDLTHHEELQRLKDIENLRVLKITWKEVKKVEVKGSSQSKEEGEHFEGFSFPRELEKLDLRCIPFKKQPEWLNPSHLSSLKSLYIRGGKLDGLASKADQKADPEVDQEWKVNILRLKYLYDFKADIQKLKKDFPHLKYVEKIKCEAEVNAHDEVWGAEYYEEDEWSGENKVNETKQAAPVQGEAKTKESHVQESSKVVKQDDKKVLSTAATREAKASKVESDESGHVAHALNEDSEEEEKEEITTEKSREPVKGDNNQVPNKVEDEKASPSKVLTNEPNLTSTSVGKEETKADAKVEESKGLVKQGDNNQVLNKVEDYGGSTNKLISDESHLVSPIMN